MKKKASSFKKCTLLIAFADLSSFLKHAAKCTDLELMAFLQSYYDFAGEIIEKAGGTVIKCIGDALLITFPESKADAGVKALIKLKIDGDKWLEKKKSPCRNNIKVHFGPVAVGEIGPDGGRRHDIIGNAVNTAAQIRSPGMAVTTQAFEALTPATKKLFLKYTPQITYNLIEK
ncbi:MAG: adenylate/guanylate cyclase domain-containing protein [Candidatus Wallbacteria bacterium]|nr:adenylate/guanylate cyclase domain-containing protein [Candidatus Wallbacteria bacterium]